MGGYSVIRRKKPMKRGGLLKRTPLKKMSSEKRAWSRLYSESKKRDPTHLRCAMCGAYRMKDNMEPHHVFGRHNERLLAYVWLDSRCHSLVHDEGAQARMTGWIQPEMDGRPVIGPRKFPWPVEAEAAWPSNLKREYLLDSNN